jgi:hypothetical protein
MLVIMIVKPNGAGRPVSIAGLASIDRFRRADSERGD